MGCPRPLLPRRLQQSWLLPHVHKCRLEKSLVLQKVAHPEQTTASIHLSHIHLDCCSIEAPPTL